ncbi:hypothetical protein Q9R32_07325, partial [Actinotalea sp. AC32]|nr:hypothetical protein [Actinotalea sp. AC32]
SLLGRLAAPASRAAAVEALRAAGDVTLDAEALAALAGEWLAWWVASVPADVPPDEDCWDEHRLEHAFALRSSTLPTVELRSEEYPGGRLDWSALDALDGVDADGAEAGAPEVVEQRALPAPARFGGMPAPRFWEMEDARFDPGAVDAGPIDLGRLMLVSFATVYGNDWFVLPVRTPVASLSRITRFTVHDVFGEVTELSAVGADQDGWNLFALTSARADLEPGQERPTSPWFLLAPALPDWLESPPTDMAFLMRDEMANVAWAVEAVVADDHGRPRDLDRPASAEPGTQAGDHPLYRVVSEVPDHWFPLVPEQLADQESVRLRVVPVTRLVDDHAVEAAPLGPLVPPLGSWLHEEEVPRAGVQVVRTWQLARWHDGSRHVWRSRRKVTGRGEGASGLAFDRLLPVVRRA